MAIKTDNPEVNLAVNALQAKKLRNGILNFFNGGKFNLSLWISRNKKMENSHSYNFSDSDKKRTIKCHLEFNEL